MPAHPRGQSRKSRNVTLSSLLLQPAKLNWRKERTTSLREPRSYHSLVKILGRNFGWINQSFSRGCNADFPLPTLRVMKRWPSFEFTFWDGCQKSLRRWNRIKKGGCWIFSLCCSSVFTPHHFSQLLSTSLHVCFLLCMFPQCSSFWVI